MIIQWVTIHVKDMETSRKFYEDILGLKVLGKNTECFFLTDPNGVRLQIIRGGEEQ